MKVGIVGEERNSFLIHYVILFEEGEEMNIFCFYRINIVIFQQITSVILSFFLAALTCFFLQYLEPHLWTKICSPASLQSFHDTVSFGFPFSLSCSSDSGGKHGSDRDSDYTWYICKRVSYKGWRVDSAFNCALIPFSIIKLVLMIVWLWILWEVIKEYWNSNNWNSLSLLNIGVRKGRSKAWSFMSCEIKILVL